MEDGFPLRRRVRVALLLLVDYFVCEHFLPLHHPRAAALREPHLLRILLVLADDLQQANTAE